MYRLLKKAGEILGYIGLILLFVVGTVALITDYIDDYNLLNAEKEEATIIGKTAEKGLFLAPAYYVKVDLNDGREEATFKGYLNRISKKQMKNLEVGDKINGFSTGKDFSTIRDFLFDSIFYLLGITIFGLLALVLFFALILEIKIVDRFFTRLDESLGKFIWKMIGWCFKVLAIAVVLYFSTGYLSNLFHKIIPIAQTKTEAVITEKHADISYKKYQDSSYEFTLEYTSKAGEDIRVVKAVTRHTYNKYEAYQNVPISYRNSDPYNVFIQGTTGIDLLNMVTYIEWMLYMMLIGLFFIVGFIYFHKRKQNRTNDFEGKEIKEN